MFQKYQRIQINFNILGMRTITLRSHVQLKNNLQIPFNVHLPPEPLNRVASQKSLSRIEQNSANRVKPGHVFNVPIRHVANRKLEISTEGHNRAKLSWSAFMDLPDLQPFAVLTCEPVARERDLPHYLNLDFAERSFEWSASAKQNNRGILVVFIFVFEDCRLFCFKSL